MSFFSPGHALIVLILFFIFLFLNSDRIHANIDLARAEGLPANTTEDGVRRLDEMAKARARLQTARLKLLGWLVVACALEFAVIFF